MSELTPGTIPTQADDRGSVSTTGGGQTKGAYDSDRQIAIAAIIALTVVSLCCILSCTVVMYAFLNNPPW